MSLCKMGFYIASLGRFTQFVMVMPSSLDLSSGHNCSFSIFNSRANHYHKVIRSSCFVFTPPSALDFDISSLLYAVRSWVIGIYILSFKEIKK